MSWNVKSNFCELFVAPDGQKIPVKVKNSGDKTYLVEWIPNVVGKSINLSILFLCLCSGLK